MSRENIILTGFMATGKTVVGKLLAGQLGYEFVDTDDIIVERTQMSVSDIFKTKGEAAFRKIESKVAKELSEKEGLVISTGGGLMLDPANAAVLGRRGRVFCLVATPEEILNRVLVDGSVKRPLLDDPDPMQRIVEMMEQRDKHYGRFPQLVTSGKTPDQVVKHLVGIIRDNPHPCPSVFRRK